MFCQACLSRDRQLSPIKQLLGFLREIHLNELKHTKGGICWECKAIIMKFFKFKEQARQAQEVLMSVEEIVKIQVNSLSNLKTKVLPSNQNIMSEEPECIYDKQLNLEKNNLAEGSLKRKLQSENDWVSKRANEIKTVNPIPILKVNEILNEVDPVEDGLSSTVFENITEDGIGTVKNIRQSREEEEKIDKIHIKNLSNLKAELLFVSEEPHSECDKQLEKNNLLDGSLKQKLQNEIGCVSKRTNEIKTVNPIPVIKVNDMLNKVEPVLDGLSGAVFEIIPKDGIDIVKNARQLREEEGNCENTTDLKSKSHNTSDPYDQLSQITACKRNFEMNSQNRDETPFEPKGQKIVILSDIVLVNKSGEPNLEDTSLLKASNNAFENEIVKKQNETNIDSQNCELGTLSNNPDNVVIKDEPPDDHECDSTEIVDSGSTQDTYTSKVEEVKETEKYTNHPNANVTYLQNKAVIDQNFSEDIIISKCENAFLGQMNSMNSDDYLKVREWFTTDDLYSSVFPIMNDDDITLLAKQDTLICAFGVRLLNKKDFLDKGFRIYKASCEMRDLAMLVMHLKSADEKINSLIDAFYSMRYYKTIFNGILNVSEFCHSKALRLSAIISECAEIAVNDFTSFDTVSDDGCKYVMKKMYTRIQNNLRHQISVYLLENKKFAQIKTYKKSENTRNLEFDYEKHLRKYSANGQLYRFYPVQVKKLRQHFSTYLKQNIVPGRQEIVTFVQKYGTLFSEHSYQKIYDWVSRQITTNKVTKKMQNKKNGSFKRMALSRDIPHFIIRDKNDRGQKLKQKNIVNANQQVSSNVTKIATRKENTYEDDTVDTRRTDDLFVSKKWSRKQLLKIIEHSLFCKMDKSGLRQDVLEELINSNNNLFYYNNWLEIYVCLRDTLLKNSDVFLYTFEILRNVIDVSSAMTNTEEIDELKKIITPKPAGIKKLEEFESCWTMEQKREIEAHFKHHLRSKTLPLQSTVQSFINRYREIYSSITIEDILCFINFKNRSENSPVRISTDINKVEESAENLGINYFNSHTWTALKKTLTFKYFANHINYHRKPNFTEVERFKNLYRALYTDISIEQIQCMVHYFYTVGCADIPSTNNEEITTKEQMAEIVEYFKPYIEYKIKPPDQIVVNFRAEREDLYYNKSWMDINEMIITNFS